MTSSLADTIRAWMTSQRWFAAKNSAARIVALENLRQSCGASDGSEILDYAVEIDAGSATSIYHVPLTRYDSYPAALSHAVVAEHDGAWLVDGLHDLAYLRCALRSLPLKITAARVLSGEQSNTSVILNTASHGTIIAKFMRVLGEGVNPEIEISAALSSIPDAPVPSFYGAVEGVWHHGGHERRGYLVSAVEFLDDAIDGWELARDAVTDNADIDAFGLGRATAALHRALASVFPTTPADSATRTALHHQWLERAELARMEADLPQSYASRIDAVYADAVDSEWPPLQRVHGDYHLGQVLSSPSRGWMIIDFEGEPLRPLAERRAPDLALRDVAGMLRSFDYAAGIDPSPQALAWAARHREEFLRGYAAAGDNPGQYLAVLNALELDKALYEVRYEARNRPNWVPIPIRGIDNIVGE